MAPAPESPELRRLEEQLRISARNAFEELERSFGFGCDSIDDRQLHHHPPGSDQLPAESGSRTIYAENLSSSRWNASEAAARLQPPLAKQHGDDLMLTVCRQWEAWADEVEAKTMMTALAALQDLPQPPKDDCSNSGLLLPGAWIMLTKAASRGATALQGALLQSDERRREKEEAAAAIQTEKVSAEAAEAVQCTQCACHEARLLDMADEIESLRQRLHDVQQSYASTEDQRAHMVSTIRGVLARHASPSLGPSLGDGGGLGSWSPSDLASRSGQVIGSRSASLRSPEPQRLAAEGLTPRLGDEVGQTDGSPETPGASWLEQRLGAEGAQELIEHLERNKDDVITRT
eukprot:CAMPEP_0178371554 /NCGR_PEP_ID=MMETSP0689_2-20121128/886_1 /TAXON_ID=160604 /ORGANISM="Amphidinium massartii, Strain CS-259" /LENGTH=346 /DNA_ID=CAMNT_0019991427 /DNA_START=18 /DNA_END=1055 /DNA_ORIENTATION=-